MNIVASIVSHNQADLLATLLHDLDHLVFAHPIQLIVTENSTNASSLAVAKASKHFKNGLLQCIHNPKALGFGANHNQAFNHSRLGEGSALDRFFFVLNPDLRLEQDIFDKLSDRLAKDSTLGIIAPEVFTPEGVLDDTARYFPSVPRLAKKLLFNDRGMFPRHDTQLYFPDLIAGMCLGFTARAYKDLGGFDERYFMYYEDADICRRAKKLNYQPAVDPRVSVVHAAQRDSHKDLGMMLTHIGSMIRFLITRAN